MTADVALRGVERVFLDTAPVIYFVERNPNYIEVLDYVFSFIDAGRLEVVTSPITLAECLILPMRSGQESLREQFTDLIVRARGVRFETSINKSTAETAAALRANYNLTLADAFQVAIAIHTDCAALLTNDVSLNRVKEIRSLVVSELEPPDDMPLRYT